MLLFIIIMLLFIMNFNIKAIKIQHEVNNSLITNEVVSQAFSDHSIYII